MEFKSLFGITKNNPGRTFRMPSCPFDIYTFSASKFPEMAGLEIVTSLGGDWREFSYNGDTNHPIALMAREILWYRTLELEFAVVENRTYRGKETRDG